WNFFRHRSSSSVKPFSFPSVECLESRIAPAAISAPGFTVKNTHNSGKGRLLWAINKANNTLGDDVILFKESLAGKTIKISSTLEITEGVTIDASATG